MGTEQISISSLIEVGDVVIKSSGGTLSFFDLIYQQAIVVSVTPFILMSEDARGRWDNENPDDYYTVNKTDTATLALAKLVADLQ
jgi:hypothetical protein